MYYLGTLHNKLTSDIGTIHYKFKQVFQMFIVWEKQKQGRKITYDMPKVCIPLQS